MSICTRISVSRKLSTEIPGEIVEVLHLFLAALIRRDRCRELFEAELYCEGFLFAFEPK